ncbi:MAG: hypothetical protein WAX04_13150 [Oscillospiraceae bacterium]
MAKLDENFIGKFWGTLTEKDEDMLLENSICIDPKTGVAPTKTCACIVKLTENLSIPGYYTMGGSEDTVEIDDDEKISRYIV